MNNIHTEVKKINDAINITEGTCILALYKSDTTLEQLQEIHRAMQFVHKAKNELTRNIAEYNDQHILSIRTDPFAHVRKALSYIRQKHGG